MRATLSSIIRQCVSLCATIPIPIHPKNSSTCCLKTCNCRRLERNCLVLSIPYCLLLSRLQTINSHHLLVSNFQRIVLPMQRPFSSGGLRLSYWVCSCTRWFSRPFAYCVTVAISSVRHSVYCFLLIPPGSLPVYMSLPSAALRCC